MHSPRNLRPKTYALLFLEVCFGALGNTLFDKGMKEIGPLSFASGPQIWAGALRTFSSGTIWMGLLCMLLFIVCHMLVLSWADFSFVMPFSAVSYALVPLLAYLFLNEHVSAARWFGIVLIVLGVLLINRTPHRTTEPKTVSEMT